MTRRKTAEALPIPDRVRDETITVPKGETEYWLLLDDAEVELLATGLCPADVSRRAWEMLSWKREHVRNQARSVA